MSSMIVATSVPGDASKQYHNASDDAEADNDVMMLKLWWLTITDIIILSGT